MPPLTSRDLSLHCLSDHGFLPFYVPDPMLVCCSSNIPCILFPQGIFTCCFCASPMSVLAHSLPSGLDTKATFSVTLSPANLFEMSAFYTDTSQSPSLGYFFLLGTFYHCLTYCMSCLFSCLLSISCPPPLQYKLHKEFSSVLFTTVFLTPTTVLSTQ